MPESAQRENIGLGIACGAWSTHPSQGTLQIKSIILGTFLCVYLFLIGTSATGFFPYGEEFFFWSTGFFSSPVGFFPLGFSTKIN